MYWLLAHCATSVSGFYSRFDQLITNQLLYRLSYTSDYAIYFAVKVILA